MLLVDKMTKDEALKDWLGKESSGNRVRTFGDYLLYYKKLLDRNQQHKQLFYYGQNILSEVASYSEYKVNSPILSIIQLLKLDAKLQLIDFYLDMLDEKLMTEQEIIHLVETDHQSYNQELFGYPKGIYEELPYSVIFLDSH